MRALAGLLRMPGVAGAAACTLLLAAAALLAPWLAPHDPFDLARLDLLDAFTPPAWMARGRWTFPLGTDNQGRDLLSAILHGTRISLAVSLAGVGLSLLGGVAAGLLAGFAGGVTDALLMRLADVQLAFPALLVALLIDGLAHVAAAGEAATGPGTVLVLAIALSGWVQYARTVRGSVLVERQREYVQAARIIGRSTPAILLLHILPNVLGPVFVLATLHVGNAILTEATLSFLGVGMPPTEPSLGTLVRVGNDFLLSGEWWIALFPGLALVLLVLSVNVLGDRLRDLLNPRLR